MCSHRRAEYVCCCFAAALHKPLRVGFGFVAVQAHQVLNLRMSANVSQLGLRGQLATRVQACKKDITRSARRGWK